MGIEEIKKAKEEAKKVITRPSQKVAALLIALGPATASEILKNITNTIHIENDSELDNYKEIIEKSQKISITAGASTPQNVIEKVVEQLNK